MPCGDAPDLTELTEGAQLHFLFAQPSARPNHSPEPLAPNQRPTQRQGCVGCEPHPALDYAVPCLIAGAGGGGTRPTGGGGVAADPSAPHEREQSVVGKLPVRGRVGRDNAAVDAAHHEVEQNPPTIFRPSAVSRSVRRRATSTVAVPTRASPTPSSEGRRERALPDFRHP